jgi:hypothetical protein
MPALPYPQYSIDKLYLFPYYQTADAYEKATGKPCPPWNPALRQKHWEDPQAQNTGDDFVVYAVVLATDMKVTGVALHGADGQPYTRQMVIPYDAAVTVNIPAVVGGMPTDKAQLPEYPSPMRPLESNEQLFFEPVMATPAVKNTDLYVSALDNTFTATDRALLQAIAKKLGV